MNIINPATENIITTLSPDTVSSIEDKVQLLKKGQKIWAQTPLTDRVDALERFAAFLQQHSEACAEILSMEVGKPLQQARNEVNGACARIAWLTATC